MIDALAADLRHAFPEMRGFSPRNLKYMRAFAAAYPDRQFLQQAAAQIPWFRNRKIISKIEDPNGREWYIPQTIASGWSRNVLVMPAVTSAGKMQKKTKGCADLHSSLPVSSPRRPEGEIRKNLARTVTDCRRPCQGSLFRGLIKVQWRWCIHGSPGRNRRYGNCPTACWTIWSMQAFWLGPKPWVFPEALR